MTKKKKVGNLYGRPLVEGDPNYIKNKEILVKKEGKFVTLAERQRNELLTLSSISDTGENYGDIKIAMVLYPTEGLKIDIIYNPDTLHAVAKKVPTLAYSSDYKCAEAFEYTIDSELFMLYFKDVEIAKDDKWFDRNILVNLIKDNVVSAYNYEVPGIKRLAPLIFFRVPFASFKDGILKGIGTTKENTKAGAKYPQNICFSSANYKGDSVEDKFEIAGYVENEAMNVATDESYIVVKNSLMTFSPLVNGIFTIGTLAGTSDLVLINCMKMDLKFVREMLGLPESVVIPCKEGEYIKYPNIYNFEETSTRARNTNSMQDTLNENREMLLNILKKQVASLEAAIGESSEES